MKKTASITAILLLLFNGAGAIYGGWSLMADSSGRKLDVSLSALNNTPFTDFLLPGIVLFICMGVFSFAALAAVVASLRSYPMLVAMEGCLLTGWIVIQVLWTQMYNPLQAIMAAIGLLLLLCGWLLHKPTIQKNVHP